MADQFALAFGESTGLPVTVVRPATIIGPRSKDWVVELSKLLRMRAVVTLDGGRTSAGLVYVDDVAYAMIALAEDPSAASKAFNVVDPNVMTWRDYFDLIADGIGAPRPKIDLDSRLATAIAMGNEALYRLLQMRKRPWLTRHVVLLLSRDQGYRVERLLSHVAHFPATGIASGLAQTIDWLRQDSKPLWTPDRGGCGTAASHQIA